MIKYTICPEQTLRPRDTVQDGFPSEEEYLVNVFKKLEEKGLEDRFYIPDPGKRIFLYSFDIGGDECCVFFRRTGVNTGHFTQRIEMPSGMYLHSNSLEFTFE